MKKKKEINDGTAGIDNRRFIKKNKKVEEEQGTIVTLVNAISHSQLPTNYLKLVDSRMDSGMDSRI